MYDNYSLIKGMANLGNTCFVNLYIVYPAHMN